MTLDGTAGWEGRPLSLLDCGSPSWEEGVRGLTLWVRKKSLQGSLSPGLALCPPLAPGGQLRPPGHGGSEAKATSQLLRGSDRFVSEKPVSSTGAGGGDLNCTYGRQVPGETDGLFLLFESPRGHRRRVSCLYGWCSLSLQKEAERKPSKPLPCSWGWR